jgi:hypothetical protein
MPEDPSPEHVFHLELRYEHVTMVESLGEKKYIETEKEDLIKKEDENYDAPSLGKILRGRVCYKLVSEHGYNTWPAWAHGRVA